MTEKHWRNAVIGAEASIADGIQNLENASLQICLVTDAEGRLLGTVTDGDVRRAVLCNLPLSTPIKKIMGTSPVWAAPGEDRETLLALMTEKDVRHVPLLDDGGRIVGLARYADLVAARPRDNWVVLMVGGLGTRLHPMTERQPKPLLKVGRKPLIESIIERLAHHQFHRFYLSINYLGEQIRDYCQDGSKWGVEIRYLEEEKRLGTAGALRLIPETPRLPLLVMNGDLLTKVDYRRLLDFHHEQTAQATLCVRAYDFEVPFGVVKLEEGRLTGIEEKPIQSFFVNAGIYVLEPEVLSLIGEGEKIDMPNLFQRAMEQGMETTAFPFRDYWLDVGRMEDFVRAEGDYGEVFG